MAATRRATLLLPDPAGPSMAMVSFGILAAESRGRLETHDVIAAINVNGFAGNSGASFGEEEDGSSSDFGRIDIALERRAIGVCFEHFAEIGNPSRRECLVRAGGNGIAAITPRAEFFRGKTDSGFQAGLGHTHAVELRTDFFRAG